MKIRLIGRYLNGELLWTTSIDPCFRSSIFGAYNYAKLHHGKASK